MAGEVSPAGSGGCAPSCEHTVPTLTARLLQGAGAVVLLASLVAAVLSMASGGWNAQGCGLLCMALTGALLAGGLQCRPTGTARAHLCGLMLASGVLAMVLLDWSELARGTGTAWAYGILLFPLVAYLGAGPNAVDVSLCALLLWVGLSATELTAPFGLVDAGFAARGGPCSCASPPCAAPVGEVLHAAVRAFAVLAAATFGSRAALAAEQERAALQAAVEQCGAASQLLVYTQAEAAMDVIRRSDGAGPPAAEMLRVSLDSLAALLREYRAYVPEQYHTITVPLPPTAGSNPPPSSPASPGGRRSIGFSRFATDPALASTPPPAADGCPPGCVLETSQMMSSAGSKSTEAATGQVVRLRAPSMTLTDRDDLLPNRLNSGKQSPVFSRHDTKLNESVKFSLGGEAVRIRYATILSAATGIPDAASGDPSELAERALSFAEVLVHSVRDCEGQIVMLSSHRATASWNALTSFLDHQTAACRCAGNIIGRLCGLQRFTQQFDCRCREWWGVGVATGTVLSGAVGTSACRRLFASGDAADMSLSLCALCPRMPALCLVTEQTHEAVEGSFSMRPVELVPYAPSPPCRLHPDERPFTVVYALQTRAPSETDAALFALLRMGDRAKLLSCLPPRPLDPITARLAALARDGGDLGMVFAGWKHAGGGRTPAPSEGDDGGMQERAKTAVEEHLGPPVVASQQNNGGTPSFRAIGAAGRVPSLSPSLVDSLAESARIQMEEGSAAGSDGSADSLESFTGGGEHGTRYILGQDILGRGAFGVVRLCLHTTGGLYAAKLVSLPLGLLREGQLTLTLSKDSEGKVGMRRDNTRVKKVYEGTPAAVAGLEVGMEIVAINDQPVQDPWASPTAVDVGEQLRCAGDTFTMTVVDVAHSRRFRDARASVRDLLAEIEMLRSLRSEHVVPLIDCGTKAGYIIIVMEYASGGSLLSVVRSFGRLPVTTVVRYTRGMLRGLELLHRRDIAHRDFKSANVLLGSDGQTKLTDFGCAQHIGRIRDAKADVVGTPLYLAPEACEGRATPASDVWSLGIVSCELLTGSPPYNMDECRDPRAIVARLALGLLLPRVPRQVPCIPRRFLKECFQVDPKKRPAASALLGHAFMTVQPQPHCIDSPIVPSDSDTESDGASVNEEVASLAASVALRSTGPAPTPGSAPNVSPRFGMSAEDLKSDLSE